MPDLDPQVLDPIEYLEGFAVTAEEQTAAIVRTLGYLARAGQFDTEKIDRIGDAAQRIVAAFEQVFPVIDDVYVSAEAAGYVSPEEEYDLFDRPGVIARFIGNRPSFTLAELRSHLRLNQALLPGEKTATVLREAMPDVVAYYANRGREVQLGRDQHGALYLGFNRVAPAKSATRATSSKVPAQLPASPARQEVAVTQEAELPPEEELELPVTDAEIDRALAAVRLEGGMAKLKALQLRLGRSFMLSPARVEQIVETAIATDRLFKRRLRKGDRALALEPEAPSQPSVTPVKQSEAKDSHKESEAEADALELELHYIKVVSFVMDMLSPLDSVERGRTYEYLWERSGIKTIMNFATFRSLVRRGVDDDLLRIERVIPPQNRNSRRAHYKSGPVTYVKVKDLETQKRWSTDSAAVLAELEEKALERALEVA